MTINSRVVSIPALKREMIPYTADELIRIAEAEFAWMEEELVAASREMGYGDDWRVSELKLSLNRIAGPAVHRVVDAWLRKCRQLERPE